MTTTHTYIGTFGTKYGAETHPQFPGLTGDHYVTIEAPNIDQAHDTMWHHFGHHWAFIYPAEDFTPHHLKEAYPAGCFLTIKTQKS